MRRLWLIALSMLPLVAAAQQTDAAAEVAAAYGHRLWRGGEVSLSEKVRFAGGMSEYSQSKTALQLQQRLLRRRLSLYDMKLKVGATYTFINRLNDGKNPYYENQHRLATQTNLTYTYGFFQIGGRTRLQTTFRDESRGEYRYNPKWALRFRLSAGYTMPDKPWKFGLYAESFRRLNDPRGSFVDEIRTAAEVTRIIDGHQSITLYGKYFHEIQVKEPLRMFCIGLRYEIE